MQLVVYLSVPGLEGGPRPRSVQSNFEGKKEENHQQNKFETAREESKTYVHCKRKEDFQMLTKGMFTFSHFL